MVRSKEVLEEEIRRVTARSLAQWDRGKPVMPGGVIKGAYWSAPHPIYVERAEGCYLWDLDGRRYVDFANHHTAMVLGHSHPTVVEAVQNALNRGLGFGGPTTLEVEIAEEIVKRFPSIEKVRFANSGTEALLHATRMVRAATGKPKVAKFEGAYHGSHDALEVSTSPPLDRAGPTDSPVSVASWEGMSEGSEGDVVVLPYNQPESVELILREHQDEVAGVFYDGKPGIYDIPFEFTRFVRELTRELGLFMVMDEVVSFRAGYGGYQGLAGVEPDLTTFGKIMGGGLPVGVIGGSAELMDVLDNTRGRPKVLQSGTFSGNHLTLAAGLANLQALTPELYEHLDGLRERLDTGLRDIFGRAQIPCQVQSVGSIVSFDFTDQPVRDYRSAASVDKALFERVRLELLLRGYYMFGGMGLCPSAPMSAEHVDGLLGALEAALSDGADQV